VTRRTERIGEQIREELARLLREEAWDPRIGMVTLTRVDVSPDLGNARVYWSRVAAAPEDEAAATDRSEEGLESAAGFLRRRLAGILRLKRVPELRFVRDPSLALGNETLSLLRELGDGTRE
jgi:ribosome-binding factor A